jgi:hypothetical protein
MDYCTVGVDYLSYRNDLIARSDKNHAVENKYEASFNKALVKIYTREAERLLELTRDTRL